MTATRPEASAQQGQSGRPGQGSGQGALEKTDRSSSSPLVTERGKTSIADGVVQKVAGISARSVSGVHNLGTGGARAFGAIKERIPGSRGPSASQGVSVEVGEREAAVDLDIVVEYGVSIVDVANAVRRNVIQAVERMTGLQVVEVNVSVDDVYMQGDDDSDNQQSRVQ